jgi:hypothetical protein
MGEGLAPGTGPLCALSWHRYCAQFGLIRTGLVHTDLVVGVSRLCITHCLYTELYEPLFDVS